MKKERLESVRGIPKITTDTKYTCEDASRAVLYVYNYLEQSDALSQDMINKLNEVKFKIEAAEAIKLEKSKKIKKK